MENKEVEQMLNSIKVEYALLEGKVYYQNKNIEQLEKRNSYYKSTFKDMAKKLNIKICDGYNEIDIIVAIDDLQLECKKLKQQLAAKDKALDKACGKLEYEYTHSDRGRCPNVDYGFIPKYCNKDFCNDSNKECWKELAEHETN